VPISAVTTSMNCPRSSFTARSARSGSSSSDAGRGRGFPRHPRACRQSKSARTALPQLAPAATRTFPPSIVDETGPLSRRRRSGARELDSYGVQDRRPFARHKDWAGRTPPTPG
jgi:hypothetical protein